MTQIKLVSVSGGKDSTATLLLALERHGGDVRAVFADTGNEHPTTYEYVHDYLPRATGCPIEVVKADFSGEFKAKRRNLARIADGELETDVYRGRVFKYPWTPSAAKAALDLLHPTGIPFLDLCIVRGGFPSRKRQFCTQYLKTRPLTEFAISLIDSGHTVESWQGVRADESPSRADLPEYEEVGGGLSNYRPILRWSVEDVFDFTAAKGVEPNPLYRQGMSRVGCMPCINARKDEIFAIAQRFPEEVERVAEWERLVSAVTRPRSPVSFFHMGTQGHDGRPSTIESVVEWSKTSRGGKQYDILKVSADPTACSSAYGLCE